jgi:protease-4
VAVVLVEDTIVDGESRHIPFFDIGFTGGDTIAETLRTVRKDPACRGIVLRVNSPGGSALASDIIWREVERTAEEHDKDARSSPPIVVSMGDVAASGGYYVAMGSKSVLADPLTVTGSIGVISINLDVSGLLGKLGISQVTFKEGKNPDIHSLFAPYTADQRERVQNSIRQTYDLFRKRVAKGRGMTMDRVNELGRGHVYSGIDAKGLRLVDEFGGLYQAIAMVRPWRELQIRVLPRRPGLLDLILEAVGDPFAGAGPVRKAVARRRAKTHGEGLRGVVPLALDEALSKLPLSLLYVPQDRAQLLTRWLLTE